MKRAPRRSWTRYASTIASGARKAYGVYNKYKRRRVLKGRGNASKVSKSNTLKPPSYARKTGTSSWRTFSGWKKAQPSNLRVLTKNGAPRYFEATAQNTCSTLLSGQQDWGQVDCPMNLYTPYDIVNYQGLAANAYQSKIVLISGQIQLMGTNNTNANCFVDLYTLVAKRDDTLYNPIGRYITGITNMGLGTAANWGMKLTQCPEFNAYYKIIKLSKIALAPGETFQHNLKVTCNRVQNTAYLWGDGNDVIPPNTGAVKGLTTWLLPVAYGAPYEDIVPTPLVSTTQCRVVMTYSVRYKAYNVEQNDTFMQQGVQITKTAAGEQIEVEASGLSAAYGVAN